MAVDKNILTEISKSQALWDRVLLTTPIVLTIIATLLAAMSSGESSSAQYSRSLATQYQSKAGDQWGYFQAKKIRGSGMETTLDLLRQNGSAEIAEGLSLSESFDLISNNLDEIELSARLIGHLTGNDLTARRAEMEQAAQRLSEITAHLRTEAAQLKAQLGKVIAQKQGLAATGFLADPRLPAVVDKPLDVPEIQSAIDAIAGGLDDSQTAPLVVKIDAGKLRDAFAIAAENSHAFDAAIKPIARGLEELQPIVDAESSLERRVIRSFSELESVQRRNAQELDSVPMLDVGVKLHNAYIAAQADTADLNRQFTAAKLKFQSLRYAREAEYNVAIAQLYEIQVRQSGADSDRHRLRSRHFFYGMLAAQAGVTIATFGLALRRKSLLWGLATTAGLGAVLFSSYVYLFI